jgi:hypothetical protein
MGKITIEFDHVEELGDAKLALNAVSWRSAVYEIDNYLRSTTKYQVGILNNKQASDTEIEIAEKIRDKIRDILNSYNLILD